MSNIPQSWTSFADLSNSPYSNLVQINNHRYVRYSIPKDDVLKTCEKIIKFGRCQLTIADFVFSEYPPDEEVIVHARLKPNLVLEYSEYAVPRKRALEQKTLIKEVNETEIFLEKTLCRKSFEFLSKILEKKPALVEFSSYSVPVGILQWNTIFWTLLPAN
jgi:hypothetical protein